MLLEWGGANPDKPSGRGQTPLSLVAEDGRERVVKILLEQDGVSPDKLDNDYQTLLWWAIQHSKAGGGVLLQPQGLYMRLEIFTLSCIVIF